jgi:hypothetical protein
MPEAGVWQGWVHHPQQQQRGAAKVQVAACHVIRCGHMYRAAPGDASMHADSLCGCAGPAGPRVDKTPSREV